MVSWCKKGEYNAQTSPKSALCEFKWSNARNKCVHDSMSLANLSPNPCLMWPVPNQNRLKVNTVPTPAAAWTRPWLIQEGGGGASSDKK